VFLAPGRRTVDRQHWDWIGRQLSADSGGIVSCGAAPPLPPTRLTQRRARPRRSPQNSKRGAAWSVPRVLLIAATRNTDRPLRHRQSPNDKPCKPSPRCNQIISSSTRELNLLPHLTVNTFLSPICMAEYRSAPLAICHRRDKLSTSDPASA